MKNKNYLVGGGVVVALLVLVFVWSIFTGGPAREGEEQTGTNTEAQTSSTAEIRPSVSAEGETIIIGNQLPGVSVRVDSVSVSRVSWVAVRDDMRIYGAAKVMPSSSGSATENVDIPLLRGIEAGKTYKVVVYADDGDGAFDFKKDSLVSGVEASFSALSGQ
jgi:hypothetical protein